jgi:radical SAM superfamily enzyme YgiQ (UPF0313 family)
MTVEYPTAAAVIRELKRTDQAIMTVLGGPHANALPLEALMEVPELDFAMSGEALFDFADLAQELMNNRTPAPRPGLYDRDPGCTPRGSASAVVTQEQMSGLPFPAWDKFPRCSEYPIMTQLGCPYACVFCCHNSSHVARYRPVQAVIEEIEWLVSNFRPARVTFIDETFGLRTDRTMHLLDALAVLNRRAGLTFSAQTRVNLVTQDLAPAMKAAGFRYIELGVESGDAKVLSRAQKGIQIEQVRKAVQISKNAGLKVWLKFILGLPGETPETARNTISLSVSLNPNRLSVATLVPYPGSQVYRWAREGLEGYQLLSRDWADFDKYSGKSLSIDGLSSRTLRWFQARMYLETYLRNGRVMELFRMVVKNIAVCLSFLRSLLR